MIAVAVISDRSADLYLNDCLSSLRAHGIAPTFIVDDTHHTLGMAGAVRVAWQQALDFGADYLLHWEEDFLLLAPPPIDNMALILERNPHLAQVVLLRQAWNEEEKAAGGIIEANPGAYLQCRAWGRDIAWCEHDVIFSLNPCLIPRKVLELGWPDENEAGMTERCRARGLSFAMYGEKDAPPMVEHVGHVRAEGWRE